MAINTSRCDIKHHEHATATHEFGHLLYQFKGDRNILFESDAQRIYDDYKKEISELIQRNEMESLSKIYLGNYSTNGIDEFLAEAFQEYKNCQRPSKYAKKIGKLIDVWYKK